MVERQLFAHSAKAKQKGVSYFTTSLFTTKNNIEETKLPRIAVFIVVAATKTAHSNNYRNKVAVDCHHSPHPHPQSTKPVNW